MRGRKLKQKLVDSKLRFGNYYVTHKSDIAQNSDYPPNLRQEMIKKVELLNVFTGQKINDTIKSFGFLLLLK